LSPPLKAWEVGTKRPRFIGVPPANLAYPHKIIRKSPFWKVPARRNLYLILFLFLFFF
jgi:hypothetical protein